MKTTDLEKKVLKAIVFNFYQDDSNESVIDTAIWSALINDSKYPAGIEGKTLSGVVSSLSKKGLVVTDDDGEGHGRIWITEKGYNAYTAENMTPAQKAIVDDMKRITPDPETKTGGKSPTNKHTYKIFEIDFYHGDKLGLVDTATDIITAREKAIKVAAKWCEDETPVIEKIGTGENPHHEICQGLSDFGALIEFEDYPIKMVCSVCKIVYETKPGGKIPDQESHGYCEPCAKIELDKIKVRKAWETIRDAIDARTRDPKLTDRERLEFHHRKATKIRAHQDIAGYLGILK